MRECETLCSRVAILREGRFACLGSTLELKRNVGRGTLVLVRCASTDEAPLSSCLQAHFPGSELRRRHQGGALLRFFVPAQPWSQLFAGMEELREQGLFSEYMVSDVSLGEVFLHFARSPRGVAKTPPPLAPKEV
ncbi:hypothetical protein HPB48_004955 [Haemaphysalis longicornis]|uniref:ABCA1-4-like C-terminal R2 regulatory domain-containing protein n=1 Tax=Haemaphysalis longicornis TaxID=44386 RepID=A0A9J6GCW2_HAELO|nr:hypothetical protein HPB48_004955 [Haemaphysalis longicornis]